MFTIQDFERAGPEKSTDSIMDAILFSIEKNQFAYAMSLLDSHGKGTRAERVIANTLIDSDFDVKLYGKTHDYDLLINDTIKAEVKLATIQSAGRNKTKYTFHKIKPELFDVIFFMFLNPYGATIKWTTDEMINAWAVDYTRGKDGYAITFNEYMRHKKLVYDESEKSFIRLYR